MYTFIMWIELIIYANKIMNIHESVLVTNGTLDSQQICLTLFTISFKLN